MNLNQTVYFMSLVGGVAGLSCWFLGLIYTDLVQGTATNPWVTNSVQTGLLGALISGMTVGFADRWSGDRVVPRWVLMGLGLGLIAGIISGLAATQIELALEGETTSMMARLSGIAVWMLAGGLIGLVTGLRWSGVNPFRAVHALLGGLIGGGAGGAVFLLLGSINDTFAALAYVLVGMGITLGVTLAPVLLRDGILVFISSGDPRAQNKYASPRQEWLVQSGDRFVIGSQSADMSMSMYSRDVQIYIPDALVARRHALLFEQRKRFFVQQHPDNVGPQGQPASPLQLGHANVVGTREIRDGDELVVGQTLLRFHTRKKRGEQDERWAR